MATHAYLLNYKDSVSTGWLGKAARQLRTTIAIFQAVHGVPADQQLKAHVANNKRPLFQQGYQHSRNSFFKETNVVLRVEDIIVL